MSKKKILMVNNYYQIGGGEHTVFENEVEMLKRKGHEVLTYVRSNDELKSSKLKLAFLPFTTVWSTKTFFEVRKIIKNNNIDIVHCHNTFPLISPSVYYAARSLKVPVIQTVHNFRFLCPSGILYCNGHICEECIKNNSFKFALKNKCYRNSKLQTAVLIAMLKFHRFIGTYNKISYIFLTEFNKSKFNKLIDVEGKNVYIKPNFSKMIETSKTENTDDIKFVFAGRLEENKGIKFLLESWKQMPKNYFLHIYGDGSLKNYVETVSNNSENIKFFGFRPQEEIFKDLSESKSLIFPSDWYEGFPMIITECFSIGIPVVSTNVGNQKCIVEDSQGGRLFKLNDANSFKENIVKIVENFDFYSLNAKNYYDKFLNEEYNYKKLMEIYNDVKHI